MTKFNPDFWEVLVSQEALQRFTTEDRLHHRDPTETAELHARTERAAELWPQVQAIVEEVLTDRQREVVRLYYFGQLNQREIAERLDITQQAVSEHLYGKVRDGRAVGGAIRKLRKECAEQGLTFPV